MPSFAASKALPRVFIINGRRNLWKLASVDLRVIRLVRPQRQQLNAERERRAAIARAEGDKRSVELSAEAKLYEAEKEAEAIRITADAEAYAIEVEAKANAEQTRLIAAAILDNGQPAINFEILKRQIEALGNVASGESTKTIIIPSEITGVIGSIETLMSQVRGSE